MVKKVKGETHNLPEEEDRVTKLVAANEIGSEEGPIHDTPLVDDVQPNEEEGDEDEGSSIQTLTNSRDTKWTKQMEALDMRVAAFEEDDVKQVEVLDMIIAALDAYVEKVGDDVKKREKREKGVKRMAHTLDDNLSRKLTRSKNCEK
ncbi:hypothetical protein Bca4012_030536 [Brassica carinata]